MTRSPSEIRLVIELLERAAGISLALQLNFDSTLLHDRVFAQLIYLLEGRHARLNGGDPAGVEDFSEITMLASRRVFRCECKTHGGNAPFQTANELPHNLLVWMCVTCGWIFLQKR